MARMNIQGKEEILDPFYRYRMDCLKFVDQRNNVLIDNFDKVCGDIKCDPKMFFDFLRKRLGMKLNYKNGKLILPSSVDKGRIDIYLKEFIDIYILCKRCLLPENKITKIDKFYNLSCNSCGHVINLE